MPVTHNPNYGPQEALNNEQSHEQRWLKPLIHSRPWLDLIAEMKLLYQKMSVYYPLLDKLNPLTYLLEEPQPLLSDKELLGEHLVS